MADMTFRRQVTRGPFRINVETPDDGRNVYYAIEVFDAGAIRTDIVWVGGSRIAFNNAVREHGNRLLSIRNMETGELVAGAK